ncbi:uncharacterized protein TRIADDRAFT_59226 [Trichoplax adhaerens]|uniref:Helicase domino n=1 Tax=Trichoplax adhaerens TaxID=10228 RepID=B3S577_TRIAD|nr:hypothetical protein TRIADDRAFT_59226 [Trichoplax adhaerens]EDV22089.1 hypothetical protein TRIADDRAFT_59226 [Trichoplax adhaerens]|eukprot:XP_002115244.1 hypothetical protein TRIADDRAFT_59226 [Trichoplax adhaerens]
MKRSNDTSLIESERKKKKNDSPTGLQSDIKVAISASIDCSDRGDGNARALQFNFAQRSSKVDQQQDSQVHAVKTGESNASNKDNRPTDFKEPAKNEITTEISQLMPSTTSDKSTANMPQDTMQLRQLILEFRKSEMEKIKAVFNSRLQELFFLQGGGNMMDYLAWKRRPNEQLAAFLKANEFASTTSSMLSPTTNTVTVTYTPISIESQSSNSISTTPTDGDDNKLQDLDQPSNNNQIAERRDSANGLTSPLPKSLPSETKFKSELSPSETSDLVAQRSDDIAMKAKKEVDILHRIDELKKQGLWSANRLPRASLLPVNKCHHNYLMEEMLWLSNDFIQEKKWKLNMLRKICRGVLKFHQDKEMKKQRAKKEEQQRLRRIATTLAKEVKQFWSQIDKLVQYKIRCKIEVKKKKARDLHLKLIVGQTERYSSWLMKGLYSSKPNTSEIVKNQDDADFKPVHESDDEITIEQEERLMKSGGKDYENEIEMLKRESELPLEDLIKSLPLEAFQDDKKTSENSDSEDETDNNSLAEPESEDCQNDDDFATSDQEEDDDEMTLEEQENHESGNVDHKSEIEELKKDCEMSLDDLLKMYGGTAPCTSSSDVSDISAGRDDDDDGSSDESAFESDESSSLEGTKFLIENEEASDQEKADSRDYKMELTEVSEEAKSFQPTGYTLSTTTVKTPVPFLLKHQLREYQHVGLDWLVAMDKSHLNGILADEMGLGKTIQTIALLAHLACEQSCWGPHLIIVPTSVMLNWEMELKKWCPAFKILTYYGSVKERKQKRQGWTKVNAFHVCITSYKLVLQDHSSFRRMRWQYLVLDEAHNIKNFKSKRWQKLLNFNSRNRLLLTGTPLQNNLMELWSLMHFLMPNVFSSHKDFKDWFSNPLTGMIEGSQEYNEDIINRLHKVLRPFLLRRLKREVEKQLPKKYEHVVRCKLSRRQKFLYDDYMSRTKTKETLASGQFLSVINVLMQLRKVCNHPDLFEVRPVVSPLIMEGICFITASLVVNALEYGYFDRIDLQSIGLCFTHLDFTTDSLATTRGYHLQTPKINIENELFDEDVQPVQFGYLRPVKKNEFLEKLHKIKYDKKHIPMHQIYMTQSEIAFKELPRPQSLAPSLVSPVLSISPEFLPPGYAAIDTETHDNSQVTVAGKSNEGVNKNTYNLLKDIFKDAELSAKRDKQRKDKLHRIARINARSCGMHPIIGSELVATLRECTKYDNSKSKQWTHCTYSNHPKSIDGSLFWDYTNTLIATLNVRETMLTHLQGTMNRFTMYTPVVCVPPIELHASHPAPSYLTKESRRIEILKSDLRKPCLDLHTSATRQCFNFPDRRLIQYDCGKLQALDILLHDLKAKGHRVLIFTQMTKMLDILEKFLNFHGHVYLRLDGATPVERRQMLTERFNNDKRVFCFVLSTRSGGLGVNLTGADTVVFYDSDWNPTMDAQAQDRCHRIGQTRDVHIYRLISEFTIEENILKKANQKRLLGGVAIEEGNFNTAFLKKDHIQELFSVDQPTQNKQSLATIEDIEEEVAVSKELSKNHFTQTEFEQALLLAEDKVDAQAATQARVEQAADLAEFNESVPLDTDGATTRSVSEDEETLKLEEEFVTLQSQLNPIEKYAVNFLEKSLTAETKQRIQAAEQAVAIAKKEWEITHKAALQDVNRSSSEEANDLIFASELSNNQLLTWMPPTPPDDADDNGSTLNERLRGYQNSTLSESDQPPPHNASGVRSLIVSIADTRMRKKDQRDYIRPPRSLFDRKYVTGGDNRYVSRKVKGKLNKPPLPLNVRQTETKPFPDWAIADDWALLQAIRTILDLPLSLTVSYPAHNINWDLISNVVSSSGQIYRSPRQCRERFFNTLQQREEGKVKVNKGLQTHQLISQDKGRTQVGGYNGVFDMVKRIGNKRKPTLRQMLVISHHKNSKHIESLKKSVTTTSTITPIQLAAKRVERLTKEKVQQQQLSHSQQTSQQPSWSSNLGATTASTATIRPISLTTTTLNSQVKATTANITASSGGRVNTTIIQQSHPASTTVASTQHKTTASSAQQSHQVIGKGQVTTTVTTVTGRSVLTTIPIAATSQQVGRSIQVPGSNRGSAAQTQLMQKYTPAQLRLLREKAMQSPTVQQQLQAKQMTSQPLPDPPTKRPQTPILQQKLQQGQPPKTQPSSAAIAAAAAVKQAQKIQAQHKAGLSQQLTAFTQQGGRSQSQAGQLPITSMRISQQNIPQHHSQLKQQQLLKQSQVQSSQNSAQIIKIQQLQLQKLQSKTPLSSQSQQTQQRQPLQTPSPQHKQTTVQQISREPLPVSSELSAVAYASFLLFTETHLKFL